jgi:hypothetical protein
MRSPSRVGGTLELERRVGAHLSRRWGYPRPADPPSVPALRRLAAAGVRMVPLNRRAPGAGPWTGDCPRCGRLGGVNVEPDGRWWTTCGCSPRGGDELDLALFLRDRPHVMTPAATEPEAPRARLLDLPDEP